MTIKTQGRAVKNSPEAAAKTMIANLPEKTGKSLSQWLTVVKKSGLGKHGEIVKYLKSEQGVTHGFANLIAHEHLSAGTARDGDTLVDNQYSGAKAQLRPLYQSLCDVLNTFGDDVQMAPKKSYVSIRRTKQFALIQASTKDRLDVGINLKGKKPEGRLEASGSFNAMVSHRVRLTARKDINGELKRWLREAYEAA